MNYHHYGSRMKETNNHTFHNFQTTKGTMLYWVRQDVDSGIFVWIILPHNIAYLFTC